MKIFRMETRRLVLRLTIVFAASLLLSGLAFLASGWPGAIRRGEHLYSTEDSDGRSTEIDISKVISAGQIESVTVNLLFESAIISAVSGENFTISYSGFFRGNRNAEELFTVEDGPGYLSLESHWDGFISVGSPAHLKLGIPESYAGSLVFQSGSGRLKVDGIAPSSLTASLGSGRIEASNLRSGELDLQAASGSLKIEAVSAETVSLRSGSGEISGTGITADMVTVKTGSGRTRLDDLAGSLVLDGSSGSVDVVFTNPGPTVNIDVSSGSISMTLPEDSGFDLDARTSSGRIDCEFPITVSGRMNERSLAGRVGDGSGRSMILGTASGNIRLTAGI